MQEQVKELIEEMVPNIREEVIKELRPQFEKQYNEQLKSVKQEISGQQFLDERIAEKRKEIAQQIMFQIEQEFEQEKQSLIHNVSVSLSKSRSMQVLEQQLRAKILNEYTGYVDEEVRKKIHLIKLNCQKQYDEEKAEIKNQMTNEFSMKLQTQMEQLEKSKSQLNVDYQNQKEKLQKIESEAKLFQERKESQETQYGEQIQAIHEQIKFLQDQLQQIKSLKVPKSKSKASIKKEQIKQSIQDEQTEINNQMSPYQSALKNQILQECLIYDGLQLVDYEELPELIHLEPKKKYFDQKPQQQQNIIPQYDSNPINKSELQYTVNTQINTHDSQIISFNVSQPSIAKQHYNTSQTGQKVSQKQINNQILEKENDPVTIENQEVTKPQQQSNQQAQLAEQWNKKQSSLSQSSIIEKLENLCKEKIRQSQTSSMMKNSQIQLPQDSFEELFQIDPKDNQHTKNIKLLRQELQQKFIEDIKLEDYYFQQITYLKLNFIQQFPKNQQNAVSESISQLMAIWNKGHLSFSERIDYMKRIIYSSNPGQELSVILEECENYFSQNEQIIEKLQQRQSFRSQIVKENYLVYKNKKIFAALKSLTSEIRNLLKFKFFWREVDVDQIILIDQFEQQLIEKQEMKEEIKKKVEKKFK